MSQPRTPSSHTPATPTGPGAGQVNGAAGGVRPDIEIARHVSPRRKTSRATDIDGLVREQLEHYGLDPASPFGARLAEIARPVYQAQVGAEHLWKVLVEELARLPRQDRAARFAAQKFLAFQIAKVLDTLMQPMRRTYQSIVEEQASRLARGPYPVFDNLTALFSSKPVIARTATYVYACSEWVDDAFQGRELMLEIYSRLLNPTNVSLANHIVDIEAGPEAHHYFAWNFNSGMAAVDATLSHLVGHRDIILSSRNVYGGVYQLMHDWFAKPSNLDVAVRWFDGYTEADFVEALARAQADYADRIAQGRRVYVYLESPCNPHGYCLDVPAICRAAHARGLTVIVDSTVGTPFLHRPLQRKDPLERPDFVIHSYTKDISGTGGTTAGVVIGRNERMFMGKTETVRGVDVDGTPRDWHGHETLFWNVYYIKGAFLDADKAYEVLNGLHTLELRMLQKAANTLTMAEVLSRHPSINVHSNAAPGNSNGPVRERTLYLGMPAPLFTLDFEGKGGSKPPFDREVFKRFFDALDPVLGHQISLGLTSTIVLCPAITSHSEMSDAALREAGIQPTTVRVSVGVEDPRTVIAHLIKAAQLALDPVSPGFSGRFPEPEEIDAIYRRHYTEVHQRYAQAQRPMRELLV